MKGIGILTMLLLAGFWISCEQVSTGGGTGQLLSDGYISYSVNGIPFVAHDSLLGGDPSLFEISALEIDSTLTISGSGINITVEHCIDTGTYLLSMDSAGSSFGSVMVHDSFWSNYATDFGHTGFVHLTQFDLAKKTLEGIFTFLAQKRNGAVSDTVRIVNGMLYHFPLNRN